MPSVNDPTNPAQRQYLELDVPEFVDLLPHAEELTLVSLSEGHATNFRWGLFFFSGFDRNSEASIVQVGADISAAGSLRHSAYTTVGSFMLESRLLVGYGYNTGSAAVLSAVASGALLVRTVGM